MTARCATELFPAARCRRGDRGFTLLEVLVSLGIIAGALAGIAALLPAAGSRLADATDIDRAATMAANARADLVTRGLLRYQLWQQATGATPNTRAIVFGEGLTIGGAAVSMTSATSTIALANPLAVAQRIDPATGFQLRDAVQVTTVGTSIVAGSGYDPGVCYGCMLSSTVAPSTAGAPARLSTVVFRNPSPTAQGFVLTGSAGLPLQVTGTLQDNGSVGSLDLATAAALRKQYLGGCSWVLAVPPSGSASEPRWVAIASSWTAYAPGQTTGSPAGTSSLSLTGTDWWGLLSGGTLRVFGFDGLLRVDERFVNLE
jgi:prepilin-type N-terminal cleavage/methylation domain-containing protein